MKQHFNIHVSGWVQGVGFRYAARIKALQYDLTGTVMNRADGSVYIEIEGSPESCNAFIKWCSTGPDFGRVDNLSVNESNLVGYTSFSIRR
ncbi:MAG: acylphosphatase [Bacteroidales bacterium]|nr:acylphosphatase [Bacteroidales bacterium]MBN2697390.1 acylphosphatase [Bacteroidales bacterium]